MTLARLLSSCRSPVTRYFILWWMNSSQEEVAACLGIRKSLRIMRKSETGAMGWSRSRCLRHFRAAMGSYYYQ